MKTFAEGHPSEVRRKRIALQFILLLGVVSLLGDITYEGARSIAGPYLGMLGASAAVVGLVAGLGEFLGYVLRLASGIIADRAKAYWPLTIVGYGLLCAIPLMAFAGEWHLAALLMILERVGKGIRAPARDAILSHATKQVGRGLSFGIHFVFLSVAGFANFQIISYHFKLHSVISDSQIPLFYAIAMGTDAVVGLLYDFSLPLLFLFPMLMEGLAGVLFCVMKKETKAAN